MKYFTRKKLLGFLSAFLLLVNFFILLQTVSAAFNPEINYQAKLLDSVGDPVDDNGYNIQFKLYTVSSGGSPIWTETHCYSPDSGATCDGTGTDSRINTINGLFSVMLGSVNSLANVNFNQTLYLGINIGGTATTPSYDGEMAPRKLLGAVPAAFEADRLDGISSEQFLRNDTYNATNSATTSLVVRQNGAGDVARFLGTNGTSGLIISSSGKIGINDSTPTFNLDVTGNGRFTSFVDASHFVATSTSATSTFAGGLSVSGITNVNKLTINNQYGTSGQALVSNGNGTAPTWQAVLSSYGIGSTVTSGTSGSVLYVNASGQLAQDNSNFFYDATNKFLRLNSGTGAVVLGDITGNARGSDAVDIQSSRSVTSQVASGTFSSVFGSRNTASSEYSTSIGHQNTASASAGTTLGYNNTSSGANSSSLGSSNNASAQYSSAVGYSNTASLLSASAFGNSNTASENYSSAFGHLNNSTAVYASTFGTSNDAYGDYSSALGGFNTAGASYTSAFGYGNNTTSSYGSAFGYLNTISNVNGSAVGYSNTVSGGYSTAYGHNNLASSNYTSSVGSDNTASGSNSSAFGYNNNASGQQGIAFGYGNLASGLFAATAVGYSNVASIREGTAIGQENTASGQYGSAVGYKNTASGLRSSAFGYFTRATAAGSSVFGGGGNGTGVLITNSVANSTLIGPGATTSIHILGTGEVKLPYLTATSTTATSNFAGILNLNKLTVNSQYGTSGQALVSNGNGTAPTWQTIASGGMSIGDSVTSGTARSVLFIDGSGNLAQSNSSFNWDYSNNRLGIGTSTPWAKLSVTNTGAGPSFIVEDSASPDSTPFIIDASGKVGIGTSTPSLSLSVGGTGTTTLIQGNAHIQGALKIGNSSLYLNGSGISSTAAFNLTSGGATFTFPTSQGTVNQILTTNGSGVLSWMSVDDLVTPSSATSTQGIARLGMTNGVYRNSCFVTNDGSVYCSGENASNQLGIGNETGTRSLPVKMLLPAGKTASSTAAAHANNFVVMTDGTVYSVGSNGAGVLGLGDTTQRNVPTLISGLTGVKKIVTSIEGTTSLNSWHTLQSACALKNDGTVWCWGHNGSGQLGDGSTTDRSSPVQVIKTDNSALTGVADIVISGMNYAHACALRTDNSVYCWGKNQYGQVGDGTTVNKSKATLVSGLSATKIESYSYQYTNSYGHTCAINTSGALYCWGINEAGQLGDGTLTSRSVPTAVLGMSTGVIDVDMGMRTTYAIVSTSTTRQLYAWGYNGYGQLGDGSTTNRSSPIKVNLNNVSKVESGGAEQGSSYSTACALKTDGTVYCMGYNGTGQVGDGTTTNRNTPTQVASLKDITDIATGGWQAEYNFCALTSGGNAQCWGYNTQGQLGIGTTINAYAPQDVRIWSGSGSGSGGSSVWSTNSNNAYYDSGNVGIGNTLPTSKLNVVQNSVNPGLEVQQDGTGYIASFKDGSDKVFHIEDGGSIVIGDKPVTSESAWSTSYNGAEDEIISLAVYNGKLYAGQGWSSGDGDIYVYDGTSWAISYNGGQEVIKSMAVYNGKLYAGQGYHTGDGDILVFDGTSWSTSYNGIQEEILSLAVYNGKLYAGQGSGFGDGDILVFNGTSWSVSYDGGVNAFYSLAVYNGKLYAGQGATAGSGDVYVFDGSSWTLSYNGVQEKITSLGVYNGKLYAGQGYHSGDGDILVFDGSSWSTSYDGSNEEFFSFATYNGKLYAGEGSSTGDGDIYVFDGSSWVKSYNGPQEIIGSLAVYNGKLYAGQGNSAGSGDGDVLVYTAQSTSTYPLLFRLDEGANQTEGALWFQDDTIAGLSGGPGSTRGVFKLSHSLITTAGAYDLAEDYFTYDHTILPGQLVSLDINNPGHVVRSQGYGDKNIIGIYSENPGFRLSQTDEMQNGAKAIPVALSGRVPAKASLQNGFIKIGDYLMAGEEKGTVVKATKPGKVIGRALADYKGEESGTDSVMVFIQPSIISWNEIINQTLGLTVTTPLSTATSTATSTLPTFATTTESISTTTPPITSQEPQDAFYIASSNTNFRNITIDKSGSLNFTNNFGNTSSLSNTGSWSDASDISNQSEITNLNYGLNDLLNIAPRQYKVKVGIDKDGNVIWKDDIGFVAQELEQYIPEAVFGENGSKSISYGRLTALTVSAIQDINKRINMFSAPTSTPSMTLDVLGNVNINTNLYVDGHANLNSLVVTSTSTSRFGGALSIGNSISLKGNGTSTLMLSTEGITSSGSFGINGDKLHISSDGKIGIGTTTPQYQLTLSQGAYSDGYDWYTSSSKDLKENFEDIDKTDVLTRINNLTIQSWKYKTDATETIHLGPLSEEFFKEFGLGNSSTTISTMDAIGVSFAGIQALSLRVEELASKSVSMVIGAVNFVKDLVVENLKIGSREKPTGITFYDEVTGEPYCLSIRNLTKVTRKGECGTPQEQVTQSIIENTLIDGNDGGSSTPIVDTSDDTSSTTDDTLINTDETEVTAPLPSTSTSPTVIPVPTPKLEPEPQVITAPAPPPTPTPTPKPSSTSTEVVL